jgi:hypothetical protein
VALPKNGVIEAPKIVPSAFGLLAVVDTQTADEDRWIRGFSQEWETDLYGLYNVDDTNADETLIAGNGNVTYYDEIKPFFVEVQEDRSTFAFLGLDRLERLKRQCDAATQRAVEQELWDGAIRKAAGHTNRALTSNTVTILNSGTAVSPKRALAILEQGIAAASHAGEQGIIHATRDVVALLSSNSNMLFHEKDKDHLQTMGGTPVVVGSGYTGTGPDGATGATATVDNKWIYATGTVRVFLGDVDIVNDSLSQAYDVSGNANDMRIKAIRPAAAYFDTSIHLAVRVDLTA